MRQHVVTTKYVCGVDLHSKTLTAVVMDISGNTLAKGTYPCGLEGIGEMLLSFGSDVTVGVESTYNWYWLLDGLRGRGIPCVLGHALYISICWEGSIRAIRWMLQGWLTC